MCYDYLFSPPTLIIPYKPDNTHSLSFITLLVVTVILGGALER
jgi:hypothetical protein